MSAAEVRRRRREGEPWALPGSDIVVMIKRPGLRAMAAQAGKVPNGLSQRVVTWLAKNTAGTSLLDEKPKTDEQILKDYFEESRVLDEILTHIFVSPKYVVDREPNEDANEIGSEDITDFDKSWLVYRYTMGAVEDIARFRVDIGDGELGRPGETVWNPATE
jgi:hypothetical protein